MNRVRTVIAGLAAVVLAAGAPDVHADEPASINFGMGGSWFSPATSGQGFVFDVVTRHWSEPQLFIAYWFTYAGQSGGPEAKRWMLAEGEFEWGDSSVLLDIYQFVGGAFDQPGPPEAMLVGSAELVFHSCASAVLSYQLDVDGEQHAASGGTIALERLTADMTCRLVPQATLEVPQQVSPGESFQVRYTVSNPTGVPLFLSTPHSCLVGISIYRDGGRIDFRGSLGACATVVTHHYLPGSGTLERVFEIDAATGHHDPQPVPEGWYTVEAVSEVRSINGITGTMPAVKQEFIVE